MTKRTTNSSVAKRLLSYIAPYSKYALIGIFSLIFLALTTLYLPILLGQGLIDKVLGSEEGLRQLNFLAIQAILIYTVKGIFSYTQHFCLAYLGHAVVRDLRDDLLATVLNLPLGYYQKNRRGEIISRATNDINSIQTAVGQGLGEFVHQLVIGLGIIIITFFLHWRLALVSVLVLPLIFICIYFLGTKLRSLGKQIQAKLADISAGLQEVLAGIRVVKAYRAEKKEFSRLKTDNQYSFEINVKATRIMALVLPLIEVISVAGVVSVIWYGSREVISGNITAGTLVSFITYLGMTAGPITSLSRLFGLFQQTLASAERVFEIIDEEEELESLNLKNKLDISKGEVVFNNVSFAYEKEEVLHRISFKIHPGKLVAIVGPSGSGKTTIANLLMRFYNPDDGEILIDGVNINDVTLDSLRGQIGLVPQETFLFSGSIYESIALRCPKISLDNVIEASITANAHEFIEKLPQGYSTIIGEEGTNLSGGQRQRIALARAIVNKPKILILDEATSALDAESERNVQEALEKLKGKCTVIAIAHRLSTIQKADLILVLKDGQIKEQGTHEELLERRGIYSDLYRSNGLEQ